MTTVFRHWDALCDELDEAIEQWQRLYRSDASEIEAAYRKVIDVADSMTRFAVERALNGAAGNDARAGLMALQRRRALVPG